MFSDDYQFFYIENRPLCNWKCNSTFVASWFSMHSENQCYFARNRKKMVIIVGAFYYNSSWAKQQVYAVCCHMKMHCLQLSFCWILLIISSLCTTYTTCLCVHVQSRNNYIFFLCFSLITFKEICSLNKRNIFNLYPDIWCY